MGSVNDYEFVNVESVNVDWKYGVEGVTVRKVWQQRSCQGKLCSVSVLDDMVIKIL